MEKQKLNYIIDALALLAFLAASLTGLAIKFFMPSGIRQGRLQEFLGIQKGTWSELHDWSGILLIILVIVHLVLHRDWVFCMTKSLFSFKKQEVGSKEKN